MKMETYISELLYRHECVIVPGLGGFITNYHPAQIHPVSHTLRPPSKNISFNNQLQANDGLLANYIADSENISFASAQQKIEHFVKSIQNDLAHKKEASLSKIGVLSNDANGLISFEPDTSLNYLLDAFGLEEIQTPAILRKSNTLSISKQVARGTKEIVANKTILNWKVAAILLPLIGLSSYVSLQQEAVSDAYANYAYLNPFKEKPAALYIPRSIEMEEKTVVLSKTEVPSTRVDASSFTSVAKVHSEETTNSYHLIAGCFSSKMNAKNLVNTLKTNGFESTIIGQNPKGLFRVAFQSFSTKEKALEEMFSLKSAGKSTWLLKE